MCVCLWFVPLRFPGSSGVQASEIKFLYFKASALDAEKKINTGKKRKTWNGMAYGMVSFKINLISVLVY